MDLLDKGWFIIFLVIAFIAGNLAALRVTANMKFPRGSSPKPSESKPESESESDANTESLAEPTLKPDPVAPTDTEQNVTATQQIKTDGKQDHNHHNDLI